MKYRSSSSHCPLVGRRSFLCAQGSVILKVRAVRIRAPVNSCKGWSQGPRSNVNGGGILWTCVFCRKCRRWEARACAGVFCSRVLVFCSGEEARPLPGPAHSVPPAMRGSPVGRAGHRSWHRFRRAAFWNWDYIEPRCEKAAARRYLSPIPGIQVRITFQLSQDRRWIANAHICAYMCV